MGKSGVDEQSSDPSGLQASEQAWDQQARLSVRQLIDSLDLTPRERTGLQPEIDGLLNLQRRLEQGKIQLAVFGLVGRGKSSLLNALVGQEIFTTGPLHGVTRQISSAAWQHSDGIFKWSDSSAVSPIELIDTPGIDEVGGEQAQHLAETAAAWADLVLFVAAADLTQLEYDALGQLRQLGKPIVLVLNKADQYQDADRQLLLSQLQHRVAPLGILPDAIVAAAAAPLRTTVIQSAQGGRRFQRQRAAPQVETLKLKILEVLERDGKALVALNTLLYADMLQEKLVERKLEIRQRRADDLIWQTALTKAVAVALNPVLVADVLGGMAVDLVLVTSLSHLYGLPMTQREALQLLRTIAIATGSLSVSELLITLGLSSLKTLLGSVGLASGGLTLSPYLSVAMTQAAVAGVATYAIGQVTRTYLVNGATWGPQGPKAAIDKILADLDEASVLAHLKEELRQKLRRPQP